MRPPPSERTHRDHRTFGVVNLDKPPGPTSHQVVTWVKDILGIERAAHAGTLDPKVTGCLPILLGDATRLAQALLVGPKEYVTVLELHDEPGADFEDVLAAFESEIHQRPPRKSAVSRRLRTRRIHELTLLERDERSALCRIECESGTYIRKLCHHVGLAAGVGAHMGELRRTGTQPFDDRDLVTMHELADAVADAEAGETNQLETVLQPGEAALAHLPRVMIAPSAAEQVAHGAPVYAPGVIHADPDVTPDGSLVQCATPDGVAVCLGRLVGDPTMDRGLAVELARVLVSPRESDKRRA